MCPVGAIQPESRPASTFFAAQAQQKSRVQTVRPLDSIHAIPALTRAFYMGVVAYVTMSHAPVTM